MRPELIPPWVKWLTILIVLAVIVALAAWGWGRVRDGIYNQGVADEAARWVAAQAEAGTTQAVSERASQRASEAVTDASKAKAETISTETKAAGKAAVKEIGDVYQADPASAAPCRPDGGPAAIPAGVQSKLEAAAAAVAAARSPPG